MAAVTALALKPLGIKVHAEDGKVKNKVRLRIRASLLIE